MYLKFCRQHGFPKLVLREIATYCKLLGFSQFERSRGWRDERKQLIMIYRDSCTFNVKWKVEASLKSTPEILEVPLMGSKKLIAKEIFFHSSTHFTLNLYQVEATQREEYLYSLSELGKMVSYYTQLSEFCKFKYSHGRQLGKKKKKINSTDILQKIKLFNMAR